ncbi:thiol-disulfide oxidoreductase LTO1 [Malania oleifera]|uniref:thiol-disulfide oxidoreductase LTO1 n=1 Tax=Malania oleifera TaxID=397392 RepID=UPI0025ADD9FC|nr:thiol-disulfide oxidoreductase LTO1 [Malania oleifera]
MATFVGISIPSSSTFFSSPTPPHPSPPPLNVSSVLQFQSGCAGRVLMHPVKCLSRPSPGPETEVKTKASSSGASISTYRWCAALGGLGFLETTYLTYLKLTNSEAFCPIGGGSCGDVLSSDYAVVFGVPLPLIGMVAYGFVATLGLQLAGKNLPFGVDETSGRLILLESTTSMAAASAYFLYILSTKFSGASCSYCLMSAILSLSLFFITLKDFGLQELQKVLVLQLCVISLVVAALSISYRTSQPVPTSLAEVELQPFTTDITTESSPLALSLAGHLRSIGAKMYGAFWCSHCLEQKQMFGREAAKLLDYVECFPDGYTKGVKIAKACADARIEGFPTWVINGQALSGEQEFSELARASGFNLEALNKSN